jgi:RNA polymerase sigma factor (TIGR02999 family)
MPDTANSADITGLLHRWQAGDEQAFAELVSLTYQRLLAIAEGFVARERLSTEPAALVNEAYLRLRELQKMEWRDRHHFFSFAASQFRRTLIDHARARMAQRRPGQWQRVPLSEELSWVDAESEQILDLDRALDQLQQIDPEKTRLVELRYLIGCTVPEIAALSGMSDATVERHLRFARTWLYRRLQARHG